MKEWVRDWENGPQLGRARPRFLLTLSKSRIYRRDEVVLSNYYSFHKWTPIREGDPYIVASCPLRSVAGSGRWDTMTAASWGSSTTYADRKTSSGSSASSLWTAERTRCHCSVRLKQRWGLRYIIYIEKSMMTAHGPNVSMFESITSDVLCICCSVWVPLKTKGAF